MTPMRLTTWFRRRMGALVIASGLLGWLTLTLGYHLKSRSELIALCRSDAGYVAPLVAEVIQRRPQLWRYDGSKLADRLTSLGMGTSTSLIVHDARGVPVDLGGFAAHKGVLMWGHAAVTVGGQRAAEVWVGRDAMPLWRNTAEVALAAAIATILLASMLYLAPVRTVARAERRIVRLMSQLSLAMQEEERARIARDLHDGAGQAITAARLGLLALRKHTADDAMAAQVDGIARVLDGALDEIRWSCGALMPPALGDLGLEGALRRHCEAFAAASGLAIACEFDPSLPSMSAHAQTACYRIAQEALTNCARHAGASHVTLRLHASTDSWTLEVIDDGTGFDPSAAPLGTGLQSIRERARLLGGSFTLQPTKPGTRLMVSFPNEQGDP